MRRSDHTGSPQSKRVCSSDRSRLPGRLLWLGSVFLVAQWLTAGVVCEWRFEEGNGRAAAATGSDAPKVAFSAQWASGDFGSAAFFGGETALTAKIDDTACLRFGRDSFGISAWICPTKLALDGEGEYRRLLSKSSFPGTFWTLDIYESGRLMFAMRDDEGHTGTTRSDKGVEEGHWTHIAIIVDRREHTTSYYLNAKLDSVQPFTREFSGNLDVPGKDLLIATWRPYAGLLDNLRIHDAAVIEDEIVALVAEEEQQYRDAAFRATEPEKMVLRVPPPTGERQSMWDFEALRRSPETYDAPGFAGEDGIRALFYEGVDYRGKPTRVFAWCGIPKSADPVPGMVLVHGGGGTAFRSWVQTWMDRGYAAIAMDTCGAVPRRPEGQERGWQRHDQGGPGGWGGFDQTDRPAKDQWTYHAVAAVVRGHSLLRTLPGVDPERIGLTGISWGGYLTNIVAGVDDRFRFAVPVYGCGFLGENSAWVGRLRGMGEERALVWLRQWDPSQYVVYAEMPMLFCNGTNDHFYPLDSWQKTYRAAGGPRTLCCRVRMVHSHPPHGDPPEIAAYADAQLGDGRPLVRIVAQGREGGVLWAEWSGDVSPVKATLCYTSDTGSWEKRQWERLPAEIDQTELRVSATLPETARVAFLNLIDDRGLIVSSEHVTFRAEAQ